MKKIFFAIAMLSGVPGFAQNRNALLDNYITIKNALVNSDSKAASQAADVLYQSVKNDGNFVKKADLLKATEKLSKAGDIEKQRAMFGDVSAIMWQVVKGTDQLSQPVYYQYCPMKKAGWLSREKEIRNPYYGSSMLTCGKTVETQL